MNRHRHVSPTTTPSPWPTTKREFESVRLRDFVFKICRNLSRSQAYNLRRGVLSQRCEQRLQVWFKFAETGQHFVILRDTKARRLRLAPDPGCVSRGARDAPEDIDQLDDFSFHFTHSLSAACCR